MRLCLIMFDRVSPCPFFTFFRVPLLTAHKQTARVQFTLSKWTVWPGSQRLALSFSSLFAASPWQRIQKSHCVLRGGAGGGKKGLVDTTQWHFCGTWGELGSFRWAGQGWVFTLLKREDLARQKRRRTWPKMWCGSSPSTQQMNRSRWLNHLFLQYPTSVRKTKF